MGSLFGAAGGSRLTPVGETGTGGRLAVGGNNDWSDRFRLAGSQLDAIIHQLATRLRRVAEIVLEDPDSTRDLLTPTIWRVAEATSASLRDGSGQAETQSANARYHALKRELTNNGIGEEEVRARFWLC